MSYPLFPPEYSFHFVTRKTKVSNNVLFFVNTLKDPRSNLPNLSALWQKAIKEAHINHFKSIVNATISFSIYFWHITPHFFVSYDSLNYKLRVYFLCFMAWTVFLAVYGPVSVFDQFLTPVYNLYIESLREVSPAK